MDPHVAEALAVIKNNPDFRVLNRLRLPDGGYNKATGKSTVLQGVYVDCETTSAEPALAELLELALVPFFYEEGGRLIDVQEDNCVSFLNDPGVPVTEEVRRLTGITQEDVIGKSIDYNHVDNILLGMSLVVAHNASFDRKVLERHVPAFRAQRWACSYHDVPWREKFNAPAEKLEILAHFCAGVFYGAHRAMIDCIAGVHVLATCKDQEGRTAFEYLEEACYTEAYRIWAIGAPFGAKDLLKLHGYRWNDGSDGRPKAWHKRLTAPELDAENLWLRTECSAYPRVAEISAEDRFSVREG